MHNKQAALVVNHANYSLFDSLASLCPMPLPLPLLLLFKLHSSTILLLSFHCRAIIVVRVLCSDTLGRAITPHNYPSPLKHRQLDVPEAFTSTFVNYALTYALFYPLCHATADMQGMHIARLYALNRNYSDNKRSSRQKGQ